MRKLDKVYRYFPFVPIVLILFINIALYFTRNLDPGIFASDLLYLPALYKDVVVNGGAFSDWILTPAPYYFPDMPLYLLSNLLTGNYYYAIALFFTFQSILILYALYKIYTLFFAKDISLYLLAITFSLIHLYPTPASGYMFVSAIHYGEFIAGLFVIYFVLYTLKSKELKPSYLLMLFVLISFTAASDASFSLHFIMPIEATIFILWALKRVTVQTSFSVIAIFIAGGWFSKVLHPSFEISKDLLTGNNIVALHDLFVATYEKYPFSFFVTLAILLMAFLVLLFKNRLSYLYKHYIFVTNLIFISLYLLLMSAAILSVLALAPMPINTRYMIPFFEFPIFFFPIYLGFFKIVLENSVTRNMLSMLTLVLVVLVLANAREKLHHSTLHNDFYPPLTQCVDSFISKSGAKNGIASYWTVKPLYLSSKSTPSLSQVNFDLSPNTQISSKRWRSNDYHFAIVVNGDIDKKRLIKLNGKPDEVFSCEHVEILYYKDAFGLETMKR